MKFLFFWGWLSTARALYNPQGDDDEDFQLNELINRHLKVSMQIVDGKQPPPELKEDPWWNDEEAKLKNLDELDRQAYKDVPLSKSEINDPGRKSRHVSTVSMLLLKKDDPEA